MTGSSWSCSKVVVVVSRSQQHFGGLAGVHGAVSVGGVVEGKFEVEHLAGVDGSVPDAVHQIRQEPAYRGGPAVQVDMGREQLLAVEGDVVGDTDVADMAAGPRGLDGLQH